ncbi:MAG: GNAT family N-acetyltransferase [Peptococcaceae bacterium]|nr:GNAT family N-acetyltransferase [Peptococcaceae bacterium]
MDHSCLMRPFQPGDEGSCLDLYNFVHPVSMSEDCWRWLNLANPAGPSMIETAWDGEKLIGVYMLVPVKLWAGGEIVLGALSDVAVTHPDYRYRGVFSALGERLYRRAEERGIKIIYGFPTEHSKHGFEKTLGWDFVRGCRTLACWGCDGDGAGENPADIYEVGAAGNEFDQLWDNVARGAIRPYILAVRDKEYINWRFVTHPENRYRIFMAAGGAGPGGYMIVRTPSGAGETCVDIVDVLAVDVNSFRKLAGYVLKYYRDAGCVRIRLPAGSVFFHCAKGKGFKESGFVYYFGCRRLKSTPEFSREWYYTMGDTNEY